MSTQLKRNESLLRFLGRAKPEVVKKVIKTASPNLVESLCECCHNVLKRNVPLTSDQKRRLRRHKNNLRTLTYKKLSLKKRKQILQKGGFIGALLGPILNVLKSVVGL